MSAEQIEKMHRHVEQEIEHRSEQCERGVIAVRADNRAGIACLGPNHLLLAIELVPDLLIADCYFN